jgi:hypothetical protein
MQNANVPLHPTELNEAYSNAFNALTYHGDSYLRALSTPIIANRLRSIAIYIN